MDKLTLAKIAGSPGLILLAYGVIGLGDYKTTFLCCQPISELYVLAATALIGLALIINAIFLYRSFKKESKPTTIMKSNESI